MTDHIPADKVRHILDEWERIKEHADWDDIDNLVQDVRALLPTPPRPTLADMIAGMREEWGVHVTGYPRNIADWWEICDSPADSIEWFADEEAAEDFDGHRGDEGFMTRIVRRYVTEPEEA